MAGSRPKFDWQNFSSPTFWKTSATGTVNSLSPVSEKKAETSDDVDMEVLTSGLKQVSIADTVRATLVDTNTNFDELCGQLSSLQVGEFRANTLKEADLVAERVERDLSQIVRLHGPAKESAEEERRLMIVQVLQAYIRCLELDCEKWKCKLRESGKSEAQIEAIPIVIREFVPWEKRQAYAPAYSEEKLEKPMSNTVVDQISFVQLALNYWRSAYRYVHDYEKLLGLQPSTVEKQLWQLEQTTISYLRQAIPTTTHTDINNGRLREPRNINPATGQPLSVGKIKEMIQQQQEQSGYKLGMK